MSSIHDWYAQAEQGGFAIGSFNVSNLDMLKAVVQAAKAMQSPAIIETSDGEAQAMGLNNLVDLVANAREENQLPIFLNLDHSRTVPSVMQAIKAGFDLVHFDGSKEAYATNLSALESIVPAAHTKNILVEGECDYIIEGSEVRTMSTQEGIQQSVMTDPVRAKDFVAQTQIDTFAVSIGNVHGLYTTPKKLDFELLTQIRSSLACHLSLHGGSGISDDQIIRAIQIGRIVKINVSTELRQAYRANLEEVLADHTDELAIYKLTPHVIDEVQKIVMSKMTLFGSAGKAETS